MDISIKDYDVSAIASAHGGGGHKNAAGFILPHPPALIITNLDNCLELKRYATFNGNLIAPSKSQKMYCSLGPEFLFILNVEFIRFEAVE